MRLRKVLATLVCTFLLLPDGVSTFISFGGCGCLFLAVVKGFVKSKLLFSLFQCFVSLVLKCPRKLLSLNLVEEGFFLFHFSGS